MDKSREELMQEAEKINVEAFNIPDAITELLGYGQRNENVKAFLNGKWYYSLQTEDEMYQVFCGKTKKEYIEQRKAEDEAMKAIYEAQQKEAEELREKIKTENLPIWEKELKKYYGKEGYLRVIDDIDYLLNYDISSTILLEHLVRDTEKTIEILKAAKEGRIKEAHEMYMAIGDSYETRIKNSAASNIYHSYYMEEMLPVITADWAEWHGDDLNEVKKSLKEIKEQAKKTRAEGVLDKQSQSEKN